MNYDVLADTDLHRNRLLRAAQQLLAAAPSDSVQGETGFYSSSATPAEAQLHMGVCVDSSTNAWAYFAGFNRAEAVSGLWSWNPPARGAGTANGDKAPFTLGANSQFVVGTPLANRVTDFNSDLLDGHHALDYSGTVVPTAGMVPVYGGTGQLAGNDPVNDLDLVNRRTWLAGLTGLVVLAPVRLGTTVNLAGSRSGNVITASANGVLAVDGTTPSVADRILVKDQTSAIDNGVYVVSAAGSGSTPWVLTRATDADATGELTVGALCYVNEGTANRATQWSAQKAPGGSGAAFVINTDAIYWQKSFQQSAYTAGRGMVLNGLEFNFAQNSDYTIGSLFPASGARTVTELLAPTAKRWLSHSGVASSLPVWAQPSTADLSDWPNPVLPSPAGGGTSGVHTKWTATARTIADALLADSGSDVVGVGNSLGSAPVGLGKDTAPYAALWTNALRVKPIAGGTGQLGALLGFANTAGDANSNHKETRTWTNTDVKTWLALAPSDSSAVPTSRTLTLAGMTGQVTVSPTGAQDLTADRSWTISLDIASLDTRWMTLASAQSVTGQKTWQSQTFDASEHMVRFRVGSSSAQPALSITAGGSLLFGDGVAAPVGSIGFENDRVVHHGKPVEFGTGSPVKMTSALAAGGGAPTSLLGLNATDDVRRVSAADLWSLVGSPALAAGAVGYGSAGGLLTGDAVNLFWDATNRRLGVKTGSPSETLDVAGTLRVASTSQGLTYPGAQIVATDDATSSALWTNRTMIGAEVQAHKSGTAAMVTAATVVGLRATAKLSGGDLTSLYGVRSQPLVGAVGGGGTPSVATVASFLSAPGPVDGTGGAVATLNHFAVADIVAPFAPVTTHLGLTIPNLTSGTTITRGISMALNAAGGGVRHAIYHSGDAPSLLGGNLGFGAVTAPAARVEFDVGTTARAPMRFAATSSALLTTPIAGATESDGLRLYFTDNTPARRPLAFGDQLDFTNDPGSAEAARLRFTDLVAGKNWVESVVTGGTIGTGDWSVWVRFRVQDSSYQLVRGLWSCSSSTTDGTSPFDLGVQTTTTQGLQVFWRDSGGTQQLSSTINLAPFSGKVVDLVVQRSAGVETAYLNGERVTGYTPAASSNGAFANSATTVRFRVGNVANTVLPYTESVYRACLFNRALSAREIQELIRFGVSAADRWGSMAPYYSSNFASGVDGWSSAGAGTTVTRVAGPIGGLSDCLQMKVGTTTASIALHGASPRFKYGRLAAKIYAPSSNALVNQAYAAQFNVNNPNGYSPAGTDVWQSWSSEQKDVNGSGSNSNWVIYAARNGSLTGPPWNNTDLLYIRDVVLQQIGCIVDLDLGGVCGTVVPDRSGRFQGTVYGTTEKIVGHRQCWSDIETGTGSGLARKFSATVAAKDRDTVTVAHNLGTTALGVTVWNATGQRVETAVQRKTGDESNTLELGFGLIGSPAVTLNFLVVVWG